MLRKDLRIIFASVLLLVHLVVIVFFVKGSLYYFKVFAYSDFDLYFFQVHFLSILPISISAGILGIVGYLVALCSFDVYPGFSEKSERWFVWSYLLTFGVYLVATLGWCLLVDAPNGVIHRSFYFGNTVGGLMALVGIAGIVLRYKHHSFLPRWLPTLSTSLFLIVAGSLFLFGIGKTTIWHIVDVIQ